MTKIITKYSIIPFEQSYRDDAIFCLLSAKDALGRIPRLNEDLLDIEVNYFDKGDMFWLALDEQKRVVGMLGTKTVSPTEMWLKRFYVKPEFKRQGIGSTLIGVAFEYAAAKGFSTIHTRFRDDYVEALDFYTSHDFSESNKNEGLRHFIKKF